MRILNAFCAIYWAVQLVRFIDGSYTPSRFVVGMFIVLAIISFINFAVES